MSQRRLVLHDDTTSGEGGGGSLDGTINGVHHHDGNGVVTASNDDEYDNEYDETGLTVQQAAMQLRYELEDLFGRFTLMTTLSTTATPPPTTTTLTLPSDDDLYNDLMVLVSQYSSAALQKAMIMTVPSTSTSSSSSSSSHTRDTGRYPLHLACDHGASPAVIQFLLHADVTKQSVRHTDKWGDLPLHTACSRGVRYIPVVKLLLEHDDNDNNDDYNNDDDGNSNDNNSEEEKDDRRRDDQLGPPPFVNTSIVVNTSFQRGRRRRSTSSTLWTGRADGSLPIHTACRYNAPSQVVQMLLSNNVNDNENNVGWEDNNNDNGNDDGDGHKTMSKLPTTAESHHNHQHNHNHTNGGGGHGTLLVRGVFGQLPIHVACRCQLNVQSFQILLDCDGLDKPSVWVQDDAGRLPIHVAYVQNTKLHRCPHQRAVVRILLQAMLCGRIGRSGLIKWKAIMTWFISILENMTTTTTSSKLSSKMSSVPKERDVDVCEKLDQTRRIIQERLLDRAFVLELVLWKVACSRQQYQQPQEPSELDETTTGTTIVIGDGEVTDDGRMSMMMIPHESPPIRCRTIRDNNLHPNDWKRKCRITSGAEVIIPAVLSYLEDEPIELLLEQFRYH